LAFLGAVAEDDAERRPASPWVQSVLPERPGEEDGP
jgi:hypothetical protein